MRRKEQIRVLKQLLRHIDEGTNVDAGGVRRNPSWVYSCPELAAKEWQTFFRGHPQLVGMSGDLPAPDSFFTRQDFGLPLLATRDAQGRFRAFANVCRHRGATVETELRGQRARFSCPFHSWTYDNSGALVGLPKEGHFGAIDKSCHGLVELPAEEKYGFLWVHPEPDGALCADELVDGLADEFAAWGFERLVYTGEDTYPGEMNWKLAVDTFGETYHFATLHRNSLFEVFHGNVQAYDKYGRNHRMALCNRDIDGLRGQPEDSWQIGQGCFPVYWLFPNVQVNVSRLGMILVRIYPVPGAAGQSVSRISFYNWPQALAENRDAAADLQQGFGEIIRDEDYVAAAASQRGIESGLLKEMVFGRNEPALHHFHNTYRQVLGMEALPLLPA